MGTFQTLGHINFKTRDLKASIKFYEQLGFAPFLELCNDDGQPWIVYLRFDDNLYLELTGGGPAGQPGDCLDALATGSLQHQLAGYSAWWCYAVDGTSGGFAHRSLPPPPFLLKMITYSPTA